MEQFSVSYLAEPLTIQFLSGQDELVCDIKRATNIGLIINELLTNAVKYAYSSGTSGAIQVALETEGKDITLTVRDYGAGLEPGFGNEHKGTGLQIIDLLTEEMQGTFSIESDGGTIARLQVSLA